MISLADRILEKFPSELERLWIVADPDGILLDESILASIHQRGFDLLRYEDSVAFRAEYEKRYREPWDAGRLGPSESLILHLRRDDVSGLPWDYLRQARVVSLSLANLFANLSSAVVRQLASEMLPALFEAQNRHLGQPLGETATKEFMLLHLFRLSPHLITRPEDLWRELLGLHYRDLLLPETLVVYVERIVVDKAAFKNVPVARLFADKSLTLRVVQDSWYGYLARHGVIGTRVSEPVSLTDVPAVEIPFDHQDIRALVDAMFLDGLLHPLVARETPAGLPDWIRLGVVQRPGAARDLIADGIKNLACDLPDSAATHRTWTRSARQLGELIARYQRLDADQAKDVEAPLRALISDIDDRLHEWVACHYTDLPSLPVAKAPVMVHHVPRYLAMRRSNGESRIALVVFDGLAMDQWVHVRESVVQRAPELLFDEGACFAWLPTLTSVSRQAIFSGQLPREFAKSIGNTSREPALWTRFWENQGLPASEVCYRKALRRSDDLPELEAQLSNPAVKVAGLVIDTVDEIIHGAVLGKRGVASQLTTWCETGFVNDLFALLLRHQFHVYLTADHGNADAIGIGRMNQGVASELRGERVRTYRSEALIAESSASNPSTFRMAAGGLPSDFLPLFASGRGAFVPKGEPVVAHGGMSLEELVVPFVNVRLVN